MKYFYILGNVCSMFGLVATIYLFPESQKITTTAHWLVYGSVSLSVAFWLYFYLKPKNPIAKFIDDRTDFSGKYRDSENQSRDIVEGELEVNTLNWGAIVQLPPFEEIPTIRLLSSNNSGNINTPQIEETTEDFFKVKINSSEQVGKWKWRAKGKLLKKADNNQKLKS